MARIARHYNIHVSHGLLTLPPELRLRIYDYAIEFRCLTNGPTHRLTRVISSGCKGLRFVTEYKSQHALQPDHEPALRKTCKLIRNEALAVYCAKQQYLFCEIGISRHSCSQHRVTFYEQFQPRPVFPHETFLERLGAWVAHVGPRYITILAVTLEFPDSLNTNAMFYLRKDSYSFETAPNVFDIDEVARKVKECARVLEKALGRELKMLKWMPRQNRQALERLE